MAYTVDITNCNLYLIESELIGGSRNLTRAITERKLQEEADTWFLTWEIDDRLEVTPTEWFFNYRTDAFIADLFRLIQLGIRGELELSGEEAGDLFKLELCDDRINEYSGHVVYNETPCDEHLRKDIYKKLRIF